MKKKTFIYLLLIGAIAGAVIFFKVANPAPTHLVETEDTKKRNSIKESKYEIISKQNNSVAGDKCFKSMNQITSNSFEEFTEIMKSNKSIKDFFGNDCYSQLLKNDLYNDLLKKSGCDINLSESIDKNPNLRITFSLFSAAV
jgi:gas vesicle protein